MNDLSIFHELDHPRHPLSDDEREHVIKGAQGVYELAQVHRGDPYGRVLDFAMLQFEHDNPELGVGQTIGVRAGMAGLDIESADASGFKLSGREMGMLRMAKYSGISLATNYSRYYSFSRKLQAAARPVEATLLSTEDDYAASVHFIGLAVGLRYAELSRTREGAA